MCFLVERDSFLVLVFYAIPNNLRFGMTQNGNNGPVSPSPNKAKLLQ